MARMSLETAIRLSAEVKGGANITKVQRSLQDLGQAAQVTKQQKMALRTATLEFARANDKTITGIRSGITALRGMQEQAKIGGVFFKQYGSEIQRLEAKLKGLDGTAKAAGRSLSLRGAAASAAGTLAMGGGPMGALGAVGGSLAASGGAAGLLVAGGITLAGGAGVLASRVGVEAETAEVRLKALTDQFGEYNAAQASAARIAKELRISQVEASDGFAKLYASLRPTGITLNEIEDAFIGFTAAARVSGATAEESSNALIQLKQALASGVLQGDELRSIREQAPLVGQAIAKEMGVTIGELKKLGEEGKVTTEVVIRALAKLKGEKLGQLQQQFSTSAQAMKDLQVATEDFGRTIARVFGPTAVKLVYGFTEAVKGLNDMTVAFKSPTAATAREVISGGRMPGGALPRSVLMNGAGELFKGSSGAGGVGMTGLRREAEQLAKMRRQPVDDVLFELIKNRLSRMDSRQTGGSTDQQEARAAAAMERQTAAARAAAAAAASVSGGRTGTKARQTRSYRGGASTGWTRDRDAEQSGYDLVLPGGRGASIPSPVDNLKITGTGFQGSGAGASGRGYGAYVTGTFKGSDGKTYELLLGHLDGVNVNVGDMLRKGETIGKQGITGRTFGTHITTHVNSKSPGGDAWGTLKRDVAMPWVKGWKGGEGEDSGWISDRIDAEQKAAEEAKARADGLRSSSRSAAIAKMNLDLAKATTEEAKLQANFDRERAERMYRFSAQLAEAKSTEQQINLMKQHRLEATQAQVELDQKLVELAKDRVVELAKQQEAAMRPMLDSIEQKQAQLGGPAAVRALERRNAVGSMAAAGVDPARAGELFDENQALDQRIRKQQELNDLVNEGGQAMQGFLDSMIRGTESWQEALAGLVESLGRVLLQAGLSGLAGKDGVGLFSVLAGTFGKSFAGGGYTGSSPRAGGIDGQGGFPAILHPQETVIDHTRMMPVPYQKGAGAAATSEQIVPYQASAAAASSGLTVPFQSGGTALAVPFLKGGGTGDAAASMPMDNEPIRYESTVINGVEFVTKAQAEEIGRRSEQRTFKRLQNSPSTRRAAGIR